MIEESVRQGAERAKTEVHHAVPRCLLRLRDKADAHRELDGEGIQLWLDFEMEAMLWDVDPDVSREELAALVEGSTVEMEKEEHRDAHAGDFARWGRRGGLSTLGRYGTAWFSLLAGGRWEKVPGEDLARVFAATPEALSLLAATTTDPAELLGRHAVSAWGEASAEDAKENELSVREEFCVLNSYSVGVVGERVWITTEANCSLTCLLSPEEY